MITAASAPRYLAGSARPCAASRARFRSACATSGAVEPRNMPGRRAAPPGTVRHQETGATRPNSATNLLVKSDPRVAHGRRPTQVPFPRGPWCWQSGAQLAVDELFRHFFDTGLRRAAHRAHGFTCRDPAEGSYHPDLAGL